MALNVSRSKYLPPFVLILTILSILLMNTLTELDQWNFLGIIQSFIIAIFLGNIFKPINMVRENTGKGPGSHQWISRIVSSFHAVWISSAASLFLLITAFNHPQRNDWYQLLFNLDIGPRPLWLDKFWYFSIGTTSGYLAYDLLVVIFMLDRNVGTIIHHLITCPFMFWLRTDYPIYAAIGMLSEISTPFLNRCWFEIHRGKLIDEEKLKQFSNYLFITYFIFRVLLFPYILVMSIVKEAYYAVPLCLILTVLNLYWFYKLVKFGRQRKQMSNKEH